MRVVYLHGFASSPQSSKARFFSQKFAERGVPFSAPALDGGDFEHLSITGQLSVIRREMQGGEAVLMGSSLGGYLAALYAARYPEQVARLILLAPAFRFLERWRARFTPEQLANWQRQGSLPFFHYGAQREQALGFQLIEDARNFEPEPGFGQPALILHGVDDEVVPASGSLEFGRAHANVIVKLFPSGHELTDVLPELWAATESFLGDSAFGNPASRSV